MHLGWFAMNTSRYVTKIQKAAIAIVTVEMLRGRELECVLYTCSRSSSGNTITSILQEIAAQQLPAFSNSDACGKRLSLQN